MRARSVRLLASAAFAVASLAFFAGRSNAAGDLDACTLRSVEGTSADNTGTILDASVALGPSDIWAMGGHMSGPVSTPWAQHWDGTAWTQTPMELPKGGALISSIYDAKAFAPDDIWAVGTWTGDDPFVQHWDGRRWQAVKVPELVGTERILTGVDGTGPDDIWVVGQRFADGAERGVVLHFDGHAWTIVAAPPAAAVLQDVAMVGAEPIVVGWSIGTRGFAQGMIARLSGTVTSPAWELADVGNDPRQNLFIVGIASASTSDAWAVGFSNDSPNLDTARTFHLSGGPWQDVPVPELGGSARLVSVATDASGTVAVGQVLTDGSSRALALRATGDGWQAIPGAGDSAPDTLSGVALLDGNVWAVGRGVVTGATYGVPSARIYACA